MYQFKKIKNLNGTIIKLKNQITSWKFKMLFAINLNLHAYYVHIFNDRAKKSPSRSIYTYVKTLKLKIIRYKIKCQNYIKFKILNCNSH